MCIIKKEKKRLEPFLGVLTILFECKVTYTKRGWLQSGGANLFSCEKHGKFGGLCCESDGVLDTEASLSIFFVFLLLLLLLFIFKRKEI